VIERLTTVRSVRARLRELRQASKKSVGLVPTRGGLHAGHRSLIQRAVAEGGIVIVSCFPNFSETDATMVEEDGAQILFVPEPSELLSDSPTQIQLNSPLTQTLEGKFRPGYFDSYTLTLTRLLASLAPDRLYLSEKSWQQLKVAERLISDLGFPTKIVACPAVREDDGLAISRTSLLLSPEDRKKARVLPYLLATAQDLLDTAMPETQTDKGGVIVHWLAGLLASSQPDVIADYIAIADPETLEPLDEITDRALVAIALRIGEHRLTDCRLLRKR
jgi:pantoate--beta-alanine ligase